MAVRADAPIALATIAKETSPTAIQIRAEINREMRMSYPVWVTYVVPKKITFSIVLARPAFYSSAHAKGTWLDQGFARLRYLNGV
jgi:hypothetical protein